MPYAEVTGDLFTLGLPAIGHGCNCQGSMSGGIAREFRRRYPAMYEAYVERCGAKTFHPGDYFAWDADDVVVYNLATQQRPGRDASLHAIDTSIRNALADAAQRGLPSLGIPRIGAGIGGLAWEEVRAVLVTASTDSPVNLVVAAIAATPRPSTQ